MFYPECDQCAKNNLDLESVVKKIDPILETLSQLSVLRPEIFAQLISEKESKVSGVFEILCDEKLLFKKTYYECSNPSCESLIDIQKYKKAIDDGEIFDCPVCQIDLTKKELDEVTVFRFNPDHFKPSEKRIVKKQSQMSSDFLQIEKISILFLSADPSEASHLRTNQEFREINEKLTLTRQRDRFILEQPQLSVRPEDFSQALLNIQPHIVHFSGHGAAEGTLCFEDRLGKIQLVDPDALSELLKHFTPPLVCVVLNACYSEIQAKAIVKHVKYVIGMNSSIGDDAATAYSIGFYQALGAGRTIEQAHDLGCVQIQLQGITEYNIPQLFKK